MEGPSSLSWKKVFNIQLSNARPTLQGFLLVVAVEHHAATSDYFSCELNPGHLLLAIVLLTKVVRKTCSICSTCGLILLW